MTDHQHEWKLAAHAGGVSVIDTFPEKYPYVCECGAFTHDPDTGTPCASCAPADYTQRAAEYPNLAPGGARSPAASPSRRTEGTGQPEAGAKTAAAVEAAQRLGEINDALARFDFGDP